MKDAAWPMFAAAVLFTVSAVAAEPKIDPAVWALAEKRWGKPDPKNWRGLRGLHAMRSDRLKKTLKGWDAYVVAVSNPMSVIAGRPTFLHALLVKDGKAVYLTSDKSAADFLTGLKVTVRDAGEALDLAMCFAELRSYGPRLKPLTAKPEDWTVVIEEGKNGWTVRCTFVLDPHPHISHCVRYTVHIARTGKLEAKSGRQVCIRGGYR